jgi:curli production assembly/transport component CsgG
MLANLSLKTCQVAVAIASAMALAGCASVAKRQLDEGMMPPVLNPITELNQSLRMLPPPTNNVVIAVYNYADQTGQFKPMDNVQSLSKAVTQGATSVLIKALQDCGNGSWFTVVEREKLDNLLKERRIITEMRKTYLGEENVNPQALPPLLFAGLLLEGGIIGYDSNIQTGGIGARLLGIGADVKYRLDTVTVYLRAVSTKTGQVLTSVVTHKTIASVGLQGNVFKFIAVDKILENEAGITKNEPEQLGVQQAIEKAVYALIVEGAQQGLWTFADRSYQSKAIRDYQSEMYTADQQAKLPGEAGKVNVAEATPAAPRQSAGQKPAAAPAATAQNKSQPAPPAASATPPAANKKATTTGSINTAPHAGAAATMLSSSSGEQAIAGNTPN